MDTLRLILSKIGRRVRVAHEVTCAEIHVFVVRDSRSPSMWLLVGYSVNAT